MREVILWGGTGQARVLNECLFGSDNTIVAVFDNSSVAAPFPDVPLHVGEGGFRSWMKTRQVNSDLYFLVAVGGQDRLRLHDWLVNEGLLPLTVNFSSAGTSDPNGRPLTYDWDFGDATPHSSAANPSHVYTTAGRYAASFPRAFALT